MSTVAVASALQSGVALPEWLAHGLVVALGGGLVGMSIRNMFESIMSEEEAGAGGGEDVDGDGESGLMAEGADADPGEPDEEADDDLAGLGGLDDGGDELGGFDDDGFGEMDESDEAVAEVEHRIDELENEVGSLSSTVNTVRNENEQIAESVDEVEENVRKLLDIYEMVTRGVNPFADDVDAGMAGAGAGDDGFGLFAEEEAAGTQDVLDQDVAEADAEGFFEDDLEEADEAVEADADVGDVLGDDGAETADEDFEEFDDEFQDVDDADEAAADEADGTSFEDLKEEYEAEDGEFDGFEDDALGDDELAAADDLAAEEFFDEDAAASEGDDEDVAGTAGDEESGPTEEKRARTPPEESPGPAEPYLRSLPDGVTAELIAVEWLEYLVEAAGVRETARALEYYESIDWIDERAADDLREYLAGFDGGGGGSLTIDHHTKSLEYIGQLDGGKTSAAALERLADGGGTDGVQR